MNRYIRVRAMSARSREEMLDRLERMTELPLLLLSFVMVPVLLGPLLWELTPREATVFDTLNAYIWAIFAGDLVIKVAVAPRRWEFLKSHWLEVVVVVVPFFRSLRLVRLFLFGSRAFVRARRLVNVDFILVYAIGVVIIAATVITAAEQGHDTIVSFPDALWWSVVTVTTVGYGDMTPVTVTGRAVAVVLMVGGIGLFGGLTANLASAIMRSESHIESDVQDMVRELRALRDQVGGVPAPLEVEERVFTVPEPAEGFSTRGGMNIIRERLSGLWSLLRYGRTRSDSEADRRGERMPDAQTFRQAWGNFATGVSIITTVRADGEVHGMTANGINSVSLDPLLVLVCAGHTTSSYPMIKETGRFAINILGEDQQAFAEYYARPTDQKTGDLDITFTRTEQGSAVVDGSLAQMDCKVVNEYVAGDHTIFIGEVEQIEIGEGEPLLYYQGRFSHLAAG